MGRLISDLDVELCIETSSNFRSAYFLHAVGEHCRPRQQMKVVALTNGMMMKVGVEVSPTMYDHTPDMYRMRMPTDSLFCSRGQRSLFRAIWK